MISLNKKNDSHHSANRFTWEIKITLYLYKLEINVIYMFWF